MAKSDKKTGSDQIVLIIEDDRGLNTLIQKTLQRAGFRTDGALTGEDGIKKAIESDVSMMLLDYKLPDMKGSLLVESIREKKRDIPFVIVTGHGDEKVAVDMMKLGARDYIVKDKGFMEMLPFVLDKVIKELARERKLADTEKKIMQAAHEWRITFDSIADFVSVHDRDFRILKVNRAFADFLGMGINEVIGRHCYQVLHNTDEPIADCPHIEMLKTRKTVTRNLYNENLRRHLMISVSPIFDEEGEITSSVHYMKDITPLKESEEELKDRVEDLEKFYEMAINREVRMKELKREVNRLKDELSGCGKEVS